MKSMLFKILLLTGLSIVNPALADEPAKPEHAIRALKFSPDAKHLVSLADSGEKNQLLAQSWRLDSGAEENRYLLKAPFKMDSVKTLLDKSSTVKANSDKQLIEFTDTGFEVLFMLDLPAYENYTQYPRVNAAIWRSNTGEMIKKQIFSPDYMGLGNKIAFSADGKYVAEPDTAKRIRLWDRRENKIVKVFDLYAFNHTDNDYRDTYAKLLKLVHFNPQGNRLFIADTNYGGKADKAYEVDIEQNKIEYSPLVQSEDKKSSSHALGDILYFSAELNRLVTKDPNASKSSVSIRDMFSNTPPVQCRYVGKLQSAILSNNGDYLVGEVSGDIAVIDEKPLIKTGKTLLIWNARTGELLHLLHENTANTTVFTLSPDSQWLAAGDSEGGISLWELASGDLVKTLK